MDKSKFVEYVQKNIVNYEDGVFDGCALQEDFTVDLSEADGSVEVKIFITAEVYAEKGFYKQFYCAYGNGPAFDVAYTHAQVDVDNYMIEGEFFKALFNNYSEYEGE